VNIKDAVFFLTPVFLNDVVSLSIGEINVFTNTLNAPVLFPAPGPAVPHAPRGSSPALHGGAGPEAFLDRLSGYAAALQAHAARRAAPRQGGRTHTHTHILFISSR